MLECLARYVNGLPSKADRLTFLKLFAKGKPEAAVSELKAEMIKQWGKRR